MQIQEISSSGAAEAKRKDMAVKAAAATRRPPSPKRRGTTDYSKWDAIDSDDDEQSAGGGAGGDVLGIPGLNVGKISENDPKVVQAKADPKVQVGGWCGCRACAPSHACRRRPGASATSGVQSRAGATFFRAAPVCGAVRSLVANIDNAD